MVMETEALLVCGIRERFIRRGSYARHFLFGRVFEFAVRRTHRSRETIICSTAISRIRKPSGCQRSVFRWKERCYLALRGITSRADSLKSYKDGGKDLVMEMLGETIQPMKESFIVAFLNCAGISKEHQVVPKEIEDERQRRLLEPPDKPVEPKQKKRDVDGNIRPDNNNNHRHPQSRRSSSGYGLAGQVMKVIDDDLEDIDNEHFNSRQSFLNLCRGNHYQFDKLRTIETHL